ncbi:hypothetical protein C8J31_101179 [Rhizobium sp. PP-CC-2G-626]|nr:hypothetical protein C8J31_101179 [Rhizobium sp. PP-CC-2G-626]
MSFDQILESHFRADVTPSVEAFGGLDALLLRGSELGQSSYADHYFDLVFPFRGSRTAEVDQFLVDLLLSVSCGPELAAIMDSLFGLALSNPTGEQRIFKHFLSTATDRTAAPLLRTASLRGALGFLRDDSVRLARMVAEVADTAADDDPFYIAHAARIAGVLSGVRNEPALLQFLTSVRDFDGCADQVDLEIGLITIQNAIQAETSDEVIELLNVAREAFEKAANKGETRYEARIFSSAISMLLNFYEHRTPDDYLAVVADMKSNAFAYAHYSGAGPNDPVLGSIASQGMALVQLAESLRELLENLQDDVWIEASALIEKHLLFAYSANRTVFNGQSGSGFDCVIRPVIDPFIFGNRNHVASLNGWLKKRAFAMPPDLVEEIELSLQRRFETGDRPDPKDAGGLGPLSPALLERVQSTDPEGFSLLDNIASYAAAEIQRGLSLPMKRAIELLDAGFRTHADYQHDEVQQAFRNLVLHLYSFLERRLNSSIEQDMSCSYLFQNGSDLPLEKALQQDFLSHAKAVRLPLDDEVKGIAAGRADLRYKVNAHEMIIEVKRELKDASFDNLMFSYGEQTVIYQSTNVKLGVLLVLDLSKDRPNTMSFENYYDVRRGDFLSDGTDRGVVIVKVPGRRGTPSYASKIAKSRKPKKTKATAVTP